MNIFAVPRVEKLFIPPAAMKPHIERAATTAALHAGSGSTPRMSARQARNCAQMEMKVPIEEETVAVKAIAAPQREPP